MKIAICYPSSVATTVKETMFAVLVICTKEKLRTVIRFLRCESESEPDVNWRSHSRLCHEVDRDT